MSLILDVLSFTTFMYEYSDSLSLSSFVCMSAGACVKYVKYTNASFGMSVSLNIFLRFGETA